MFCYGIIIQRLTQNPPYWVFSFKGLKQLNPHLAHVISKIQDSGGSFSANKALGFAPCFISLLATKSCFICCIALTTHGKALTNIIIRNDNKINTDLCTKSPNVTYKTNTTITLTSSSFRPRAE